MSDLAEIREKRSARTGVQGNPDVARFGEKDNVATLEILNLSPRRRALKRRLRRSLAHLSRADRP
jgi:hypothetical protein